MKKALVVAAVLAAFVSVGSYQAFAGDKAAADTAQTAPTGKYVCKHCKESADQPGKCPKCGMEMKKNKAATTQPAAVEKNSKKEQAH